MKPLQCFHRGGRGSTQALKGGHSRHWDLTFSGPKKARGGSAENNLERVLQAGVGVGCRLARCIYPRG